MRYDANFCRSFITHQKNTLENVKADLEKNFDQMDFDNALEHKEMEEKKDAMIKKINAMLLSLSNYTFR